MMLNALLLILTSNFSVVETLRVDFQKNLPLVTLNNEFIGLYKIRITTVSKLGSNTPTSNDISEPIKKKISSESGETTTGGIFGGGA